MNITLNNQTIIIMFVISIAYVELLNDYRFGLSVHILYKWIWICVNHLILIKLTIIPWIRICMNHIFYTSTIIF